MPADLPGDDPKRIWQNQPTEVSAMTLEKIQYKAQELHKKTRRELSGSIAIALGTIAISTRGILWAHDSSMRVVFALAIAWALTGQYFVHRGIWSYSLPGDSALSTGLDFYQREIARRGRLFPRVLRWSLGPFLLSIGTLIFLLAGFAISRGQSLRQMIPFSVLFATWLVAFFVLRSRSQRQLRREIEELGDWEPPPRSR